MSTSWALRARVPLGSLTAFRSRSTCWPSGTCWSRSTCYALGTYISSITLNPLWSLCTLRSHHIAHNHVITRGQYQDQYAILDTTAHNAQPIIAGYAWLTTTPNVTFGTAFTCVTLDALDALRSLNARLPSWSLRTWRTHDSTRIKGGCIAHV